MNRFEYMRKWLDEGIKVVPVSVNVSRVQLFDDTFVNRIIKAREKYMTGKADWNCPDGGFYIWTTIKDSISTDQLFKKALKKKILLNPGNIYDFSTNRSLRISYAYEDAATFEKAIKEIADMI